MKELICIVCPNGCRLQVDEENGNQVTGNRCPKGAEYGRTELQHPTRVVTSTVCCTGSVYPRCSVKTDRPVPKKKVRDVMWALDSVCLTAPVHIGDVIVSDLCGTGANLVATRNMEKETENG